MSRARSTFGASLGVWLLFGVTLVPAPLRAEDACLDDAQCKGLVDSARLLSKSEKYDAALTVYQTSYQRWPARWLLFNIGRIQQKLKQKKAAASSFRRYLDDKSGPRDDETYHRAEEYLAELEPTPQPAGPLQGAETYLREGNWREALRSASVRATWESNPEAATRIIGIAACHLRDLNRAQESYSGLSGESRQAISSACYESGIRSLADRLHEAESLLRAGDYEGARQAADLKSFSGLSLPNRALRVVGLASCHLKDGEWAEAVLARLDNATKKEITQECEAAGTLFSPPRQRPPRRLVPPQFAARALIRARLYFSQNQLLQAMLTAREAIDGERLEGWTIFGMASCAIGDVDKVNEAYAGALPEERQKIVAACSAHQILRTADGSFVAKD